MCNLIPCCGVCASDLIQNGSLVSALHHTLEQQSCLGWRLSRCSSLTLLSRAASSSFGAEQWAAVKSWGAGSWKSGVGGFHGSWWPNPAHLCLRQSGEGEGGGRRGTSSPYSMCCMEGQGWETRTMCSVSLHFPVSFVHVSVRFLLFASQCQKMRVQKYLSFSWILFKNLVL